MKYTRVGNLMIRPLLQSGPSAFDLARAFYEKVGLDFDKTLIDYLRTGYVIARPKLFCLVKPIVHEGENIWFIEVIVGNLVEAIMCLPCMLSKIAFCRDNQTDKMVICDTERLIKVAAMTMKRKEQSGRR